MANNILSRHYASGVRRYATLRDAAGQKWDDDGSAWETMDFASWADYVVTMTESPADSGLFVLTVPSAIEEGRYWCDIHEPRYQSEDPLDDVIEAIVFDWSSTEIESMSEATQAALNTASPGSPTADSAYAELDLAKSVSQAALLDTTIATVTSQTEFILTAGAAHDSAYAEQTAILYDTDGSPSIRRVLTYVASTKTLTIDEAADFTVVDTDSIKIYAGTGGGPNIKTDTTIIECE